MAVGTPFHARTSELCKSMDWRHWSGYLAASSYDDFVQPEYAAIRNAAAFIDVSPLFKYRVSGPDATALVDRVFTRPAASCDVLQAIYTPWCDAAGHIIQEGTVFRLAEDVWQVNAAEPALRWLALNATGLDLRLDDRSATIGTLAVQGPRSRDVLAAAVGDQVESLKFFRLARGDVAGVPVLISRTGYTGDLGYEVWMEADHAVRVWDALMEAGEPWGGRACGLLAMDIARVEAGFVLINVDYVSADVARIPSHLISPYELGMGWAVKLEGGRFVGRDALARNRDNGVGRALVGLAIDWEPLERIHAEAGLMPDLPLQACRESIPVYAGDRWVGRATTRVWSTLLKKYIAIATVESAHSAPGSRVEMEITVDFRRRRAPARVVKLPHFRPDRLRG